MQQRMTNFRKTNRKQTRAPILSEPVECVKFHANRRGETIIITLCEYEGRALVDLRKFYPTADGKLRPTPKGIRILLSRLPDLSDGIRKTLARAEELGLIAHARATDK